MSDQPSITSDKGSQSDQLVPDTEKRCNDPEFMARLREQVCPRRCLETGPWSMDPEPTDHWDVREQFANGLVALHCSFCGSLHPDTLMAGLRDGTLVIDGSDKSYKWYIGYPLTDEQAADKYDWWLGTAATRALPEGEINKRWEIDKEWVLTPSHESKFYTPHLSRPQALEFVELWRSHPDRIRLYRRPWLAALADDAPAWLHRDYARETQPSTP